MGRIRVDTFRGIDSAPEKINATGSVGARKTECSKPAQHLEDAQSRKDSYSILPRNVKDDDLPLIPAVEVEKRDGKGDNRLCTHLCSSHLPPYYEC